MKKLYNENRTLFIILATAVGCILLSLILLLKYFYFGNGQTKYGDRLNGVVKIEDNKINEIKSNIQMDEKVASVSINVSGRIIYTKITFNNSATLVDAENVAVKSLEQYSEEEKNCYDFEFILYQDSTEEKEGFRIMGAKNVNGSNLVWTNNNATTTDVQ